MVSTQTERRLLQANVGQIFERRADPYGGYRLAYPELLTNSVAALAHDHIAAPRMVDLGRGPRPIILTLAAPGIDMLAVDPSSKILPTVRKQAGGREERRAIRNLVGARCPGGARDT
ncbi:hypothetical protein ACFT0G_28955 [Streptomyces sp. NPDC057020]|uniref:hypothetical protein n=1 Tax=unclassified Streptomyces TaxID=2593676 RepID=UPI003624F66E